MQFLKKSSEVGIFRLFQCLVKGNSIGEERGEISFKDKDFSDDELLLIVNIDVKDKREENRSKCLKKFVKLPQGVAIPDLLLIYVKHINNEIFTKFFLIELGPHKESDLKKKENGARILFNELGLKINQWKFLNIIDKRGSSHKQIKKYKPIKSTKLLHYIKESE